MKKAIISLLFIILIICSSVLTANLIMVNAQTGTQVSGLLWDNTTWTLANSPYIITSTIQIPSNVTLTIQAGVTVQATSSITNMFILAGNVVACGTPSSMITFDGGGHADFFNQYSLTGTPNQAKLTMDFCNLKNGGAIWFSSNSAAGYFNLTHSIINNTQGVPYLQPYSHSAVPHSSKWLLAITFGRIR